MNYKKTLNMPFTDFPMRGNLPVNEEKIQAYWRNSSLYQRVLVKNKNNQPFYFLQGPPYANHAIHIGHALNAILKDAVIKHKWLNQTYAPFALGWDTHGLPIEKAVNKTLDHKQSYSVSEFYQLAKDYASKQVELQNKQFQRLGLVVDDKNKYLTNDPKYIYKELQLFNILRQKGLLFQARKPVYWSSSHKTALADAEIIYDNLSTPSCYFTFLVKSGNNLPANCHLCVWTTTPWTLLVNQAVAVNQNFTYLLIENNAKFYIIGEKSLASLKETLNFNNAKIVKKISHTDLISIVYINSLTNQQHHVISSNHVTDDTGTMLVHVAPAHGPEDYTLSYQHDISIVNALDENSNIIIKGPYENLNYLKANPLIVEQLKKSGHLLHFTEFEHSAPLDWRSKQPVYYLASKQWFIDLKPLVKNLDVLFNKIHFYPSWAQTRLHNMLVHRQEWCISRQRKYGVPILIVFDENNKIVTDNDVYEELLNDIKMHGLSSWHNKSLTEILSHKIVSQYNVAAWTKSTDILDVWFDSGTAFFAGYDDNITNYNLVIEGSDQYRGWFNSLILLSAVISETNPPYQHLLSHGFVLDKRRKKMSKSLGNVVDPADIIKEYGADILRLFFLSCDYQNDIAFHKSYLIQIVEKYRKIRNTFRFLLGNLSLIKTYDFLHIEESSILSLNNLAPIDKYLINKIQQLNLKINEYHNKYQFNLVINEINNFIINELSSFYFEYAKDILYVSDIKSDRYTQISYVLYLTLQFLLKNCAPIIPHTCEEAYLAGSDFIVHNKFSIFLHGWDFSDWIDQYCSINNEQWDAFFALRFAINQQFDNLQKEKIVNSKFALAVTIFTDDATKKLLSDLPLQDYLGVGELTFTNKKQPIAVEGDKIFINVTKFAGEKCLRCWKYFEKAAMRDYHEDKICTHCYQLLTK